jgi:hypothetical protein
MTNNYGVRPNGMVIRCGLIPKRYVTPTCANTTCDLKPLKRQGRAYIRVPSGRLKLLGLTPSIIKAR